jgi:hypothetical protein
MPIVTFLSDFGDTDHYVASVKGVILSKAPEIQIVDISHQIQPFDIGHASYVLSHAFRDFPKGTIHLVALNSNDKTTDRAIALELEGHFFVGCDSGIFSLISDKIPAKMVLIETEQQTTFLAKDVLAPACCLLAKNQNLDELGKSILDDKKLVNRQPKVTKREIVGNVIRVDSYGNLITNILREDYEKIQELNGRVPIEIQFGRERFRKLHQSFNDVDPGECYLLFNASGQLQIGINKGHAKELLGLRIDSPVFINFTT